MKKLSFNAWNPQEGGAMSQTPLPIPAFSYAGKRVLLAGASRGLGRAAAQAFAAAGARLALGARRAEQLSQVADSLSGTGHVHHAADFASRDACRDWAKRSQEALGGVDLLVVTLTAGAAQSRVEDYAASFEIDLMAPLILLDACREGLIEAKGAALFCSSRTATEYWPGTAAYGTAKSGLEYALKCAAADLAPKGVRVNAIAPGSTMTEGGFWDRASRDNPALVERTIAKQPAGRLGTPADIIPAMLFLGSDAAAWITGQTLLVDGGQTLAQFIKS